jgi:hypothetical protein
MPDNRDVETMMRKLIVLVTLMVTSLLTTAEARVPPTPSPQAIAAADAAIAEAQKNLPIQMHMIFGEAELKAYERYEDSLILTLRLKQEPTKDKKLWTALVGGNLCRAMRPFLEQGFWIYFSIHDVADHEWVKDNIPPPGRVPLMDKCKGV